MITISFPYVCKMCRIQLTDWTFGKGKKKHVIYKLSAWPTDTESLEFEYAEYTCPDCKHKGRGRVVLNADNAFVDVKEL